jgi:hypothetical protein
MTLISVRAEPVEALHLGFDRLSPNGGKMSCILKNPDHPKTVFQPQE